MPKSRPLPPADEMARRYLRRAKTPGARKPPDSDHPSPRIGSGHASESPGPGTPNTMARGLGTVTAGGAPRAAEDGAGDGTVPAGANPMARGVGTVPTGPRAESRSMARTVTPRVGTLNDGSGTVARGLGTVPGDRGPWHGGEVSGAQGHGTLDRGTGTMARGLGTEHRDSVPWFPDGGTRHRDGASGAPDLGTVPRDSATDTSNDGTLDGSTGAMARTVTTSLGTVSDGTRAESRTVPGLPDDGTLHRDSVPGTSDDGMVDGGPGTMARDLDTVPGDGGPWHGGEVSGAQGHDTLDSGARPLTSGPSTGHRAPETGAERLMGAQDGNDDPGRVPVRLGETEMGTAQQGQAAAETPSRTTARRRGARARVLADRHPAEAVHEPARNIGDGVANELSGPFAALIAERTVGAPAPAAPPPAAGSPRPDPGPSGTVAAEPADDATARVRNERADILLRMLREAGPTLPLEGVLTAFKLSAATRPSRLRERVLEPIARLLEYEGWTVAMDVSTAQKTVTVTLARNGVPEPLGAGSEHAVPGADHDVPDPFETQLGEPLDGFLDKLLAEGVAGSGPNAPPPVLSGGHGGQDAAAVGTLSERGGSGRNKPPDASVDRAGDGPSRHGSDPPGNDRLEARSGVRTGHGSDPSGNGRRNGGTGEVFPVDFDPPRGPPGPGTRFAIRRPASLSGRVSPLPDIDAAQASPAHAATPPTAPETHRPKALFDDVAAGLPPAVGTVRDVSATASRPVPSEQARALLGALFKEDDEDGEALAFAAVPAPAPAPVEASPAPVWPAEPAPAGGGVFAELLRREQEAGLQASQARPADAAMPVPSAPPPDRRGHDPAAAPPQLSQASVNDTVPAPAPPPEETESAPSENTGAAAALRPHRAPWPALDAATLAALGVLAGGLAVALLFPLGGAAAAALSPVAAGLTWWLARQDSGSALPMTVVAVIVALAFTAERHQVAALRMALLQIRADLAPTPPLGPPPP